MSCLQRANIFEFSNGFYIIRYLKLGLTKMVAAKVPKIQLVVFETSADWLKARQIACDGKNKHK